MAFDLLQDVRGRELLDHPLSHRRRRLERLLTSAPPQLPICPQTGDEHTARAWSADWSTTGIEGLVVKKQGGTYRPGKIGWTKVKNEMNCIGRNISRTMRLLFALVS